MAANTGPQVSAFAPAQGVSPLSAVAPFYVTNQGAVVDNSGEQDVLLIDTRGRTRCVIEVSNTGANALTLFKIYGRVAKGLYGPATQPGAQGTAFVGDFMQLLGNADADFTTPIGPLKYSFGANNAAVSPRTLASGAKVIIVLDCQGFADIKCTAQSTSGATLNLYGEAA